MESSLLLPPPDLVTMLSLEPPMPSSRQVWGRWMASSPTDAWKALVVVGVVKQLGDWQLGGQRGRQYHGLQAEASTDSHQVRPGRSGCNSWGTDQVMAS